MKIAQIAPLYESVPPKLYGGTERVVSYLTEELIKQGHQVTLFASGDSQTSAELSAMVPEALRLCPNCIDPLAHHIRAIELIYRRAHEFDIIHSHIDYLSFPLARLSQTPTITTLHGRLDIADLQPLYSEFSERPLVSISDSQRKPLKSVNWLKTVYHGLPTDLHNFYPTAGSYLAFLGRTSPEKGLDKAIKIAKDFGMPLKIAAKIDKVDQEYYETVLKPLIDNEPLIEFIGEVGGSVKDEFLGKAYALVFPINWPEPFGLVMIEAMACGTPVIAFNCGSVSEIIKNGQNGFIVKNEEEALQALKQIPNLSRKACREYFEQHFSASKMAQNYLELYEKLIKTKYPNNVSSGQFKKTEPKPPLELIAGSIENKLIENI